jgi:hypothetical protein
MLISEPHIGRLQLSVPAPRVLMSPGSLRAGLERAARLYLSLGGDPGLHWHHFTPLEQVLCQMAMKTERALQKALEGALPEDSTFSISVTSILHNGKWSLGVRVEAEGYLLFCVSWIEELRKTRASCYPLMRDLFRAVAMSSEFSGTTYEDIVNFLYDSHDFEEEEDEALKELVEAARAKSETLAKRLGTHPDSEARHGIVRPRNRRQLRRLISSLRRRYDKICRRLSKDEQEWAEKALKALQTSNRYGGLDSLDTDEEPLIHEAVIYAWDFDDIMEQWENYMGDRIGNDGPPAITFPVGNMRDFRKLQRHLTHLQALTALFYSNHQLQNLMESRQNA